jgi:FAD/FMN-containing dehydrogenase
MRGAGANFGIATRIDYELHPLSTVYGAPLFHRLTSEVLRFYAEFSSNLPDEVTTLGAATKFADGTLAFATVVCYCGSEKEGRKIAEPLRRFAPALIDLIQERPYVEMQSLFDADLPPGRRYCKTHNISRLDEGVIDTVLEHTATMAPYHSMIGFQLLHGAGARVASNATAYPHRYDHHVVWISPVHDDAALDAEMIGWTRECWQAMQPYADKTVYVNALDDGEEEGEAGVQQAYGGNYERLRALKRAYDPSNLFRKNFSITPV